MSHLWLQSLNLPAQSMQCLPQHPFVRYGTVESQSSSPRTKDDFYISEEMINNFQKRAIPPLLKETEATKPKHSDMSTEQKYPKIRVSLDVFNQLRCIQKAEKCKSFCDVISKLLMSYDERESFSIKSANDNA